MESLKKMKAVAFIRARHLGTNGRHPVIEAMQVEAQRKECQRIAERLDVAMVDEYLEYGGTGTIGRRPVVRQLLDRLRADPDLGYLIVTSPDRLARRRADWDAISLELEAAQVELVTMPPATREGIGLTDSLSKGARA